MDDKIKGEEYGFRVWNGKAPAMPRSHAHGEVEGNYVTRGSMRYFLSGRFQEVGPGRLTLFWAGLPHRLVGTKPDTRVFWLTLPLAWVVRVGLPRQLMERLLGGEMVADRRRNDPLDLLLLNRWAADERTAIQTRKQIMQIEVEARLRRLAMSLALPGRRPVPLSAAAGHVDAITRFIDAHFSHKLRVADIAQAAGLHPVYAMTLFKNTCGMSLWDYLLGVRVANAQRLLLTSDQKITQIALLSGFGAPSRFYEAFERRAGMTPRRYRAVHGAEESI